MFFQTCFQDEITVPVATSWRKSVRGCYCLCSNCFGKLNVDEVKASADLLEVPSKCQCAARISGDWADESRRLRLSLASLTEEGLPIRVLSN